MPTQVFYGILNVPARSSLNGNRALYGLSVLALAAMLVSGCHQQSAADRRGKLEGQVTLNGKPVVSGIVRFLALDPTGTNVVIQVSDGRFSVPEGKGPSKGKYRIEFSVPSATKRRIPNDDIPGQWLEEAAETLPARYHRGSEIMRDYDPASPQSFDFQLNTP